MSSTGPTIFWKWNLVTETAQIQKDCLTTPSVVVLLAEIMQYFNTKKYYISTFISLYFRMGDV